MVLTITIVTAIVAPHIIYEETTLVKVALGFSSEIYTIIYCCVYGYLISSVKSDMNAREICHYLFLGQMQNKNSEYHPIYIFVMRVINPIIILLLHWLPLLVYRLTESIHDYNSSIILINIAICCWFLGLTTLKPCCGCLRTPLK